MIKRFTFSALVGSALLGLSVTAAHAQAHLAFSGGSGSPLSITLLNPITYTVTQAGAGPFFTFDGVGRLIFSGPDESAFTGSWSFSVNGGSPRSITTVGSGYASGNTTADDLYAYGSTSPSVAVGDTITLNAARIVTSSNVSSAAPTQVSYATFIANASGARISNFGSPAAIVPEANTAALLGLALPMIGAVVVARRRKK